MKKTFTPAQIMSNRGCYERCKVESLPFMKLKRTHIKRIQKDIPLKDWFWFIFSACELDLEKKLELCLMLSKAVLPVFEKIMSNDTRVKDCIEAIESFNNGVISRDGLIGAAYAAADAAYAAADAAADAALAVARAVARAAYAAYAAADAALAASDAADAADAAARAAARAAADAGIEKDLIDLTLNWIDKQK